MMSLDVHREERGQLALLVRSFLARFADNEVIARGSDSTQSLIWLLAFLITPGFLMSAWFTLQLSPNLLLLLSRRFPDIIETTGWRLMAMFIGLTMSASGLVAAAAWDSLTLQRRDCLILLSLPIRPRTIVIAKLVALTLFSLGLAIGMNGPTALNYGVTSPLTTMSAFNVLKRIVAGLVATAGASLFVFWGAVAVQGTAQALCRPRIAARVSEIAQWLIAFASVLLFLVLLLLAGRTRTLLLDFDPSRWPALLWLPLYWFLGLYEYLDGSTRPVMRVLARMAATGLATVALVSLLSVLMAFEKRIRAMIEQPEISGARAHPRLARLVTRLVWRISRTPAEMAMHLFIVRSVLRSRVHRLGVSAAVGLGFALVTYGMVDRRGVGFELGLEVTPRLLSIPLVLLFCGIWGLRVLFAVPTDPSARWCFELYGDRDPLAHVRASRAVILAWLVAPIGLATCAAAWPVWGAGIAARHAIYCVILGAALTEIAVARLRRIPFTCRWVPGAARIKVLWPVFIYAFAFFAYRMASFETWLIASPARWAVFCAAAATAIAGSAWLYARRRTDAEPDFEESLEAAIQTLNLQAP